MPSFPITLLRLVPLSLLLALATPLAAQSKVVGWGPNRVDSSWNDEQFIAIAAGSDTTVARRADGTLAAWGLQGAAFMQAPTLPPGVDVVEVAVGGVCVLLLSDGTAMTLPGGAIQGYSSPIVQLSVGPSHTLALLADGRARAWGGLNQHGQNNVPFFDFDFVEVAAGTTHSLLRRADGTLLSLGSMTQVPTPPPGLSFVQITAGSNQSAALLSDGSALQWNSAGTTQAHAPAPGLSFVKISSGPVHTMALSSDGTLTGWGWNDAGQLDAPPLPPGVTYVDVSASGWGSTQPQARSHSAALRSDGKVVSFGWNGDGQTNVPPLPEGLEYERISASGFADAAGQFTWMHVAALRSDGELVVYGDHRLGQGAVPALPPGTSYVDAAAGGLHTVALRSDGRIFAWGDNSWNQLFGTPQGSGFVGVAAGPYHSLAVHEDGTVAGWGNFGSPVVAPSLPPGVTYVEVAVGRAHSVARRSDGTVVAWGAAGSGQLDVPPLPPGVTYTALSVDRDSNLALRSDGTVAAWGSNNFGQLDVPSLPPGITFLEVSVSWSYGVGLRSDGVVEVWGSLIGGKQDVPQLEPGQRYAALCAGSPAIVARVETVWSSYGTGKTHSLGCVPRIGAQGAPSASASAGFEVACEEVQNQSLGMLIYTVNQSAAATPFQCGTLYVGPTSVLRTPVRLTGGNPTPPSDCSGRLSIDMNAFAAGAGGGVPTLSSSNPAPSSTPSGGAATRATRRPATRCCRTRSST